MFFSLNGIYWVSLLLLLVGLKHTHAQNSTAPTEPPFPSSIVLSPTLPPTTTTNATTTPMIAPVATLPQTYAPQTFSPQTYAPHENVPSVTRSPSYPPYQYPSSFFNTPYPADQFVDDDDDLVESSGQNARLSAYIVGSLVIITLGILYCSRSRFENNSFTNENVTTFYEDLFKNKYLIVHWPKYLTIERKTDKRAVLFFTTRIKALWVRPLAQLQFVLGWVTFFTTIVGFANPSNRVNSNIGSAALFLGELVTHLWYGYFRYWNPSWWCLDIDSTHPSVGDFAIARERCTRLYHGGKRNSEKKMSSTSDDTEMEGEQEIDLNDDDESKEEHELPKWIEYLGFVVCAPLYIGSILGSGLGLGLSLVLACCTKDKNTDHAPVVGVVSALMGCLAYPILFNLQMDGAGLKILAIVLHHICIEYYDAKLFRKTDHKFFLSLTCKAFSDFFLEEVGLPDIELDNKILDEKNIDEESPLQTKQHQGTHDNHVNENLSPHDSGDTVHTDSNQSDNADDEKNDREIDIDVKEKWQEFAFDSNNNKNSVAGHKNAKCQKDQCIDVADETEIIVEPSHVEPLQEEFEVEWDEEININITKVESSTIADPDNTTEIVVDNNSMVKGCYVIDEEQVPTGDEQQEEEDNENENINSNEQSKKDDDDDDEDYEQMATEKETTKIVVLNKKLEP